MGNGLMVIMKNNEIMKKAHVLAKKMKEEFPSINYKTQIGINIKFLLENIRTQGNSTEEESGMEFIATETEKNIRFEDRKNLLEIVDMISEIENTSSTNEKINIIKKYENNEVFKRVLKLTYEDCRLYGFTKTSLENGLKNYEKMDNHYKNVLDTIEEYSIGAKNHETKNKIYDMIKSVEDEQIANLLKKILLKDLRCNINTKLINKAIKNLITTWDIQQGKPIESVKLKKDEWIALSLKLNGVRATYFSDSFRSRQNKTIEGLNHIESDLEKITTSLFKDSYVFDGELIRKNTDNLSDNENFRLSTGLVNSKVESTGVKEELEFVIFDLIPTNEFIKGESELKFKDRLNLLEKVNEKIEELNLKNIRIAPTYYTGTDHSMIESILNKVSSEGLEGLMCLRNHTYKTKRHSGILKCKKFKNADCFIVGYEEGQGKNKGMLGAFVIEFKGEKVNIGSGYTEKERIDFWENRDLYIGKILQVKYKEETKNKNGKCSIQFPVFEGIKLDKNKESYN